jgi:NADPH-dependent 2,4-dienoyl-CoA reductase/sulfur reductase-like enzyme
MVKLCNIWTQKGVRGLCGRVDSDPSRNLMACQQGQVTKRRSGGYGMAGSVIIIGAGIAGLATGVYARLNGYDAAIFELHDKPGGVCTGW